jgi:cell division protein FtsW
MSRRGTPDFLLLLMTFMFVGFGIVMVFSASSAEAAYEYGDAMFFTKKQIAAAGIGAVLMFALMNMPYKIWKKAYLPFFLIVVGLLVYVLTIPTAGQPRSWIDLGFFSIQPSEFAKLAIVMYLASLIMRKGEKMSLLRTGLLPIVLVVGVVATLILMQPDFGSTIVFLLSASFLIVVGGAKMQHIIMGISVVVISAALLWGGTLLSNMNLQDEYQLKRISCYLDPWHDPQGWCWQHVQAELAFGHGGLTGAGFGQSIQKLFYLPEAQNDFIFAIIGEEFGFLGVTLFILFLIFFLWRGIQVALRCRDPFGTLLGIGIVGMIGIQAFINIGGVARAIPMTGITLPFISSGGSSLLVSMMSMGILLNISRENNSIADEALNDTSEY